MKNKNLIWKPFVTQFTHVLDILDLRVEEEEKMFRENCNENVVSDLWKIVVSVHKISFSKTCKN